MKILVTGGTGFLGSHAAAALHAAGHRVRLLLRTPDKARRVFGALGMDPPEHRVGDITDAAAVDAALAGCDAVLHAAAAVGVVSGSSLAANLSGTRNVVGAAARRGLDPIVHVSSQAVLLPASEPVLTRESPLGEPLSAYGRSKLESERFVRELQARDVPAVTLYPSGVVGPRQPVLDGLNQGIVGILRWLQPVPPSGVQFVDVRDLARVLVALMRADRGPRRILAGGTFFAWPDWVQLMGGVTGRAVRSVRTPRWLLLAAGSALDLVRRVAPLSYPLTREAAFFMTDMVPMDDHHVATELGVRWRDPRTTLADTVRWLVAAGHLQARHAPGLASVRRP